MDTKRLEERRVFFPQPHAQVPVIGEDGDVTLTQWGKRDTSENPEFDVPVTGWARADKLESSFRQQHKPTTVLVPALRFSEKGKLHKSRWFDMPEETFLMGQLTKRGRGFVYIVANPAIGALAEVHPRMPLVVGSDKRPVEFDAGDDEPGFEQQKLF
jgi:hypothetical protein